MNQISFEDLRTWYRRIEEMQSGPMPDGFDDTDYHRRFAAQIVSDCPLEVLRAFNDLSDTEIRVVIALSDLERAMREHNKTFILA